MKDLKNNIPQRTVSRSAERGISIIELLIVVAMVGLVTAFAVMKIAAAQRAVRLTNSAREFTGWLEKARLDSLRRHPMGTGEMASVQITSATTYTVTIDQNGDGTLDPARTIRIPANSGASFAGIAVPTTIRYNWRGRAVDAGGNLMNLAFRIQDASGSAAPVNINVTSAGDSSLGYNVNTSTVSISGGSTTANIKPKTTVP